MRDWMTPEEREAVNFWRTEAFKEDPGWVVGVEHAVPLIDKADSRIRELEAQVKTADELPLSEFGDVLGHNYWLDANTLQALWKRMREASMRALSRNDAQAKGGAHGE